MRRWRSQQPPNVRLYARLGCYTPDPADLCPRCHGLLPIHALDCPYWRRAETVQRFSGA